jgi:hypothetical protein
MRGLALLMIGSPDVGRITFRRAGKLCPAYQIDPVGTGALR